MNGGTSEGHQLLPDYRKLKNLGHNCFEVHPSWLNYANSINIHSNSISYDYSDVLRIYYYYSDVFRIYESVDGYRTLRSFFNEGNLPPSPSENI